MVASKEFGRQTLPSVAEPDEGESMPFVRHLSYLSYLSYLSNGEFMIQKENIDYDNPSSLFKYTSVNENTFSSLINKTVYLAKTKQLNDPFECDINFVDDMTEEERIEILNDDRFKASGEVEMRMDIIKNAIKKHFNNIMILSLSATPYENLMWSHYSDEHRGICIEYDRQGCDYLSDLSLCFPVEYPKLFGRNKIRMKELIKNESKDFYDFIARAVTSRKEPVWAYEKEWRLVLNNDGGVQLFHDGLQIKSITFGLRTPDHQKLAIYKLLNQTGIKFFQAYKDKNELAIRMNEFNPDLDVSSFMAKFNA